MFGLIDNGAKLTQYRVGSIFWNQTYFGIFLADLAAYSKIDLL